MDTQVQLKNEVAIIEKKRSSWGQMGVKIYQEELTLQLRAQEALSKLEVLPTTIEEIPAAEATLKEVKALQSQLITDRKAITSKFDAVFERLMAPEKSFAVPLQMYSTVIISIKKEYEKKEEERRRKKDEIARVRQILITALARVDAEFKTLIEERINQAFTFALERGTPPGEIEDYLGRVSFRIKESVFQADLPALNLQYASDDDIKPIVDELWKINAADYVALFAVELERKFSDYHIAYLNKQDALRLAREEQARRLAEIEQQKQHREAAAELDAVSSELEVVSEVKALKKAFKIEMPDTEESAIKIMSAYVANKSLCKARTTKWLNMISPLITALERAKNQDEKFQPQGILFVETDKL